MRKWNILQTVGVIILGISLISACIREEITTHPFGIATILGIFIAMATTPLFWIGLGMEESARVKRKKLNKSSNKV